MRGTDLVRVLCRPSSVAASPDRAVKVLRMASVATHPLEAMLQSAAFQVVLELPLNVLR